MPAALLGKKIGMTRFFLESGENIPVTIIELGPCQVSQIKTDETDGYNAVQLAYEDIKGRNSTMQMIGHDAKAGVSPKRTHREVRLTADEVAELELGQVLAAESIENIKYVDVIGTSKGKGFAGVMKRHGFKGMSASHGTERKHRHGGSIGGRSAYLGGGRPKKGIKMGGRMGGERVTTRSLKVVSIDKEKNLLLVKGPVAGHRNGLVIVREAVRLYKGKARKAQAS